MWTALIVLAGFLILRALSSSAKDPETKREFSDAADRVMYGRIGKAASLKMGGCLVAIAVALFLVVFFALVGNM